MTNPYYLLLNTILIMTLEIEKRSRQCLEVFQHLYVLAEGQSPPIESELPAYVVHDETGRFKTWAGNIGALLPASNGASLDHRLREASHVRDQVLRLLDDLHQTLRERRFQKASSRQQNH